VLRQIYRPEEDLVRWGGRVDDPAGGPFDRAFDAPPGWLPDWLRPPGLRRSAGPALETDAEAATPATQA